MLPSKCQGSCPTSYPGWNGAEPSISKPYCVGWGSDSKAETPVAPDLSSGLISRLGLGHEVGIKPRLPPAAAGGDDRQRGRDGRRGVAGAQLQPQGVPGLGDAVG